MNHIRNVQNRMYILMHNIGFIDSRNHCFNFWFFKAFTKCCYSKNYATQWPRAICISWKEIVKCICNEKKNRICIFNAQQRLSGSQNHWNLCFSFLKAFRALPLNNYAILWLRALSLKLRRVVCTLQSEIMRKKLKAFVMGKSEYAFICTKAAIGRQNHWNFEFSVFKAFTKHCRLKIIQYRYYCAPIKRILLVTLLHIRNREISESTDNYWEDEALSLT